MAISCELWKNRFDLNFISFVCCIVDLETWSLDKERSPFRSFLNHLWILFSHPVYVFSVIGYTIYMFVMGIVLYWGPKGVKSIFGISGADAYMGATSSITGVIGTVAGGLLLDKFGMFASKQPDSSA